MPCLLLVLVIPGISSCHCLVNRTASSDLVSLYDAGVRCLLNWTLRVNWTPVLKQKSKVSITYQFVIIYIPVQCLAIVGRSRLVGIYVYWIESFTMTHPGISTRWRGGITLTSIGSSSYRESRAKEFPKITHIIRNQKNWVVLSSKQNPNSRLFFPELAILIVCGLVLVPVCVKDGLSSMAVSAIAIGP
jgi:hypothetical protein